MKLSPIRTGGLAIAAAVAVGLALVMPASAFAQDSRSPDAASALASALTAACRANEETFVQYLTAANAAAFRLLPAEQRFSFMKRFSLADEAGSPLLSSDAQNHIVLRCQATEGTTEFRFGAPRTSENLAFVPVTVVNSEETQFGLVREGGAWRLLSLGLVLLDIPQLSQKWAEDALVEQEDAAIKTLGSLADAIETYRRAYGNLPDSLAQLRPAPKGRISPEQASLVDDQLASGNEGGYRFRYRLIQTTQPDATAFEISAAPENYGKTGRRSFFLDAGGKIHAADKHGEMAVSEDPLLDAQATR
jgi:hypothetical protein